MGALAGTEADLTTSGSGQQPVLRNIAGLRAQLARVTGNVELASDLLQDAVVTALQKLQAGEISGSAELDGYVYRVALNHLRNYRRKDRSHAVRSEEIGTLTGESDSELPTECVEADEWAQTAKMLLQEVSPMRDRELLVRFYLREESKEELCRAFGLTEIHFNRVIFRARDRFRELLRRHGLCKTDFLSIALAALLAAQCLSAHGTQAI